MGDAPQRKSICGKHSASSLVKKPVHHARDEPSFEMPPIPSIDCFKHDPWIEHPLLKYNASNEKKRQDNEVVIRRGKKVKKSVADIVYRKKGGVVGDAPPPANSGEATENFLTQDDFAEYRRDSVKSAPVVPMQTASLKRITGMLHKELKKKHPDMFRVLVKEVEERYEMVLHETILNFVLIPPPGYVNPYALIIKNPLFYTGPPPWWESFRVNRYKIAQQLRLVYPIVAKSFLKMRELLNVFRLFYPAKIKENCSNYMRPVELKDVIIQQIRTNGEMFLQKFVPQLVRIFQNGNALRGVHEIKQELIMECASHMINCNATNWAMETIREIVVAYENYLDVLPRILVDTAVDDRRIVYAPPMEGWMYCFKKIIDEIVGVVQNIPDPSELFWRRSEADKSISVFCRIILPTFFIDEMTDRFNAVMTGWLGDAQEVADRIYDQYKPLLDGTIRTRLQTLVQSENHTFYEGFKESSLLNKYQQSVFSIAKNEFVGWLQVNNEDVIGRLLDGCKSHHNIISDHLTKWVRVHNYAIINNYKDIRSRLLKKPTSTAELMELIEYVDEARGVLLLQMKDDIVEGLRMCLAFMNYYLLSADDMELTVTAHKLLGKIQPAFQKSAIMIEDQKMQFEEQLNQKIEDMKVDLSKLVRRIRDDFGRYGDYSQVAKYCDDLKYVSKRVETLQAGIDWINAEEVLFKFNQTQFKDMTEIMLNFEPYSQLFHTVIKWQRAEKKIMDGDFKLDIASIESETHEYYMELVDLQLLFKSRIKEMKEREAKEKHIPVSLLYDEDNMDDIPPPLKLCNFTLETLNEFRSQLPTIRLLCNPHLRLKHWVQLSEIYGLDLIPNTGSSLRKYLKMNLEPFIKEFEEVSKQATIDQNVSDEDEEEEEEEDEDVDDDDDEEEQQEVLEGQEDNEEEGIVTVG